MKSTYIPDGFQVVQLDADGNEIDQEVLEASWDTVLGKTDDEIMYSHDMELVSYVDEENRLVVVTRKVFATVRLDTYEEPSQHDWIGGQTLRKNPGSGIMDTTAESAPWRDMRDVQNYRFEFREPIAEPADRAGQGFLGNVAERLPIVIGSACPTCNIMFSTTGACFC